MSAPQIRQPCPDLDLRLGTRPFDRRPAAGHHFVHQRDLRGRPGPRRGLVDGHHRPQRAVLEQGVTDDRLDLERLKHLAAFPQRNLRLQIPDDQ